MKLLMAPLLFFFSRMLRASENIMWSPDMSMTWIARVVMRGKKFPGQYKNK